MSSLFRFLLSGFTAAAVFVGRADAQPVQSLMDAWLATNDQLLALEEGQLVGKDVDLDNPPPRAFKAVAFERPQLGTTVLEVRGLIAVDDTEVWRFETNTPDVPPRLLFDAATTAPALRYVTAVAVTDDDHILISGYSRPKRVYEVWEVEIPSSGPPTFWPRASSTPQITDAVYVRPEDVTGGPLASGGLLATAGKQVLFFPKVSNPPAPPFTKVVVLADAKSLALKGATDLTSVDLVKRTDMLMIATTERTLLTRSANLSRDIVSWNQFATVGLPSALVPVANCPTLRTQRLIVRNAQGGADTSTFVADSACQQLVRYDVTSSELTTTSNAADDDATWSAPLAALAVGEGNAITCEPSQSPTDFCELISGDALGARINTSETTQLLVLQFPDLCDGRVNPACPVIPVEAGSLHLNGLLPAAFQEALGTAEITIPPYMFAARGDGHFGVVFIQADDAGDDAGAFLHLEIQELIDYELGVAENLPRLSAPNPIRVLNQDVAAYAPDNPDLPTVRGFESTPITTGSGSMEADMRGFSAIIYGLQHDVSPPSPRTATVGIPTGTTLGGSTPGVGCDLALGSQSYYPDELATDKYFFNLLACLFTDEETLLRDVIPGSYPALESSLDQVKDKLIKSLSGAGPNTGTETFQALLSQLDKFDAQVAATPFTGLQIYKNELLVRSKVFRFNVKERAIPSIPIGGF